MVSFADEDREGRAFVHVVTVIYHNIPRCVSEGGLRGGPAHAQALISTHTHSYIRYEYTFNAFLFSRTTTGRRETIGHNAKAVQ